MSYFTQVQSHELVRAAVACGISANALLFSDETYLLPSFPWVESTFSEAWLQTMQVLGISQYQADANDCDDFARMCAGYAQLLNNRTIQESRQPGKGPVKPAAGLAFGEFWFTPAQGPHAVNAFFHTLHQGGTLEIGFMEPQNGRILRPSKTEIQSCMLFRL